MAPRGGSSPKREMQARRRSERTAVGPPTPRNLEVFTALYRLTRQQGFQPNLAELGAATGVTLSCVAQHLDALKACGWIGEKGSPTTRSVPFLRRPDGSPFRGFADHHEEGDASTNQAPARPDPDRGEGLA